ncbi:MAG: bifunctional folylpolyglutamate synthase/dihydrofolate synthase [Candidatus Solibacter sp.]|nr:bifunctional folylpolyglutamate synthase/dihydrofolate synthase [Candidatus Solibacter sp.]
MDTSYPDSVRYLYALGNEFKTIKFGLERIRTLLTALALPQRAFSTIHVAGTNGKGSTCAMIESALRASGLSTGIYTSPHLVEPTERIRINGAQVSAGEFSAAFNEVHAVSNRLITDGLIDMHPTYFETITAMAYLLFRQHGVERVVLETGMGGRLDATNVVDPLLSVITPIDFDHERFLGDTIPKIAREKAGIIKPERPVVFSRQRPEAQAVLERAAIENQSEVVRAADWVAQDLHLDAYGSRFTAQGPASIPIDCPLIGAHQVENALTAIAALHHLGVPGSAIRQGIAATRWPGRLEHVSSSPDIFLDGAHNPAGAQALADYIREFHHHRRIWIIFGAMSDKDLSVIAPLLFPLASELILTGVHQARAFTPEQIRDLSGATHARLAPYIHDALAMVRETSPGDVVFITGSLYLVGEARPLLVTES